MSTGVSANAATTVARRKSFRATLGCIALVGCARVADAPKVSDSLTRAAAALPKPGSARPLPEVTPWTVTEYGVGPLKAGLTYKAAVDALKGALVIEKGADLSECNYAKWRGAPPGVLVMVDEGKIARIDMDSAGMTTREGAGVGNTELAIKQMYPDRLVITPHAYSDGHYLSLKPLNPADSLYRIVFESENGIVTHFRAGLMPNVEYVEGCS